MKMYVQLNYDACDYLTVDRSELCLKEMHRNTSTLESLSYLTTHSFYTVQHCLKADLDSTTYLRLLHAISGARTAHIKQKVAHNSCHSTLPTNYGHLATRESRHQPTRHHKTTSPPANFRTTSKSICFDFIANMTE